MANILYFFDSRDEKNPGSASYYGRTNMTNAFKEFGHELVYVDISDKKADKTVLKIIEEGGVLFAIGYSFMYVHVLNMKDNKGEVLFNKYNIPFVSTCGDYLVHPDCIPRFMPGLNHLILCLPDETDLVELPNFAPYIHQAFTSTGAAKLHESTIKRLKPINERNFRITYVGNYHSYFERKWSGIPDSVTKLINDIIDEILSNPTVPHIQVVRNVLSANDICVSKEWFRIFCLKYLRIVLLYLRSWSRREIVHRIAQAGINIDIWGGAFGFVNPPPHSWHDEKYITLHPPCSYGQMLEIMADSQITLSIGVFPGGLLDRFYSGIANGSVGLTDPNTYYFKHFVDGEDSMTFDWNKLDELPGKIVNLLSDEERMQNMVNLGREKVLKNHSYSAFCKEVLNQVEIYKSVAGI